MSTKAEIIDQRNEARDTLDQKILEAGEIMNQLALNDPKRDALNDAIADLTGSSTKLAMHELKENLDSDELAAALANIKTATANLKMEAAKMTTATSFIANADTVIGAASKVTGILKNGL